MMRMCRKGPKKMPKADTQLFVYSELDRMYPAPESADSVRASKADDGQIQKLGEIPGGWSAITPNSWTW